MVEGVHGGSRLDRDVKALACCHVADGKLHSVDLGVPGEENFVLPAQPLGQLSGRRAQAFARREREAVAFGEGPCRIGGWISHRTRSFRRRLAPSPRERPRSTAGPGAKGAAALNSVIVRFMGVPFCEIRLQLQRGPLDGGPARPFRVRFLYGTSRPSTKSWIAPAARPSESTVSLPARVLISSRSFAASGWKIATKGARPFAVTSVASPLTLIVSSLLVALTTTRSGWPSPVAPPSVPARSTFTPPTSVPLRSFTVTRSAPQRALKSTRSTPLVSIVMPATSRVNRSRLPFADSSIFSATLAPLKSILSTPSSPSMVSLPSPGSQTKVSSPAPRNAASLPPLPSIVSLPSPPNADSTPLAPAIVSSPVPPSRVRVIAWAASAAAEIASLPPSPSTSSSSFGSWC